MSERTKHPPNIQSLARLPDSRELYKPTFDFNGALTNLESPQTPIQLSAAVFDQISTKL